MPTKDTYIVDIESDNLTCTHDLNTRVYLVGVLDISTMEPTLFSTVQDFIDWYDGESLLVFHNASFDIAALRLRGATIANYYCTMVGSHTLVPGSSDEHSLATLQPQVKETLRDLLTAKGYDFKGIKKGMEYTWYGTGDSTVDNTVKEYLLKDLEATRLEYIRQQETYKDLAQSKPLLLDTLTSNMKYIETIMDMQQGVTICYDTTVEDVLSEASSRAYNTCLTIAGYNRNNTLFKPGTSPYQGSPIKAQGNYCKMEPFNPNSNTQIIDALTRLYDWRPTSVTKSGNPSVAAEVLEAMEYPLASAILEYTKSTKLMSFCDALRGKSWITPNYNQCATRTTRLSCSQPNVQQIPSRGEAGAGLRKMFVPSDGYSFLVGDQSGLQLRILAGYMSYYFGDGRLAECFNAGEDVHQFFADIYGIPRKVSKNVTFGFLFGAGINKMTATANRGNPNPISSNVIKGAISTLQERMPAMIELKQLFVEHANKNDGVIYDWLGTRYVVPELLSRDKGIRASGERKVFNYMIQGLEASWYRRLQNEARDIVSVYGGRQVLAVHDESCYEVPTYIAEDLIQPLNKVMSPSFASIAPEECDVHGLQLECEFNIGSTWYDAKG